MDNSVIAECNLHECAKVEPSLSVCAPIQMSAKLSRQALFSASSHLLPSASIAYPQFSRRSLYVQYVATPVAPQPIPQNNAPTPRKPFEQSNNAVKSSARSHSSSEQSDTDSGDDSTNDDVFTLTKLPIRRAVKPKHNKLSNSSKN
jgi:hypothetical protein